MSDITILISTSPRPSHPSPRILDATIISARAQLPNAPIIIMADGCLCETDDWIRYEGFLNALRKNPPPPTPWYGSQVSDRYANTVVQSRTQIVQQSGMLKDALDMVKTPLILYLEDDWEFVNTIEWDGLSDIIQSGFANYIRFYAGHRVIPQNEHMMGARVIERGIPLIATTQWSQNPHLASTRFYRDWVLPKCGPCDMIENLMHGPCASAGYDEYKLYIYNGIADATMQRVRHLDGKNTL